ncbi:MAG: serine O-acetyltransferase [bacterium]
MNQGAPVLEEGVAVFAGACVLGPVTIGENSIIGANAVVTKDVPPNCLVYGNPAVIREKNFEYNFS